MIEEPFESNETNNSPESSASSASEPSPDQKREISSWVADGMGLSDIQKKINTDFGIVMTYIDVRFLVDDLNLTLVDEEEEAKPEDSEAGDDVKEELSPDSPLDGDKGGVSVELDTVNPPGAMASGSVVFSDGQSKKWTLDQFGRLGLSGGDEGYKPSDEDVMEFQKQLDTSLRGRGI
jgi:hypothetical protein